MKRTADLTLTSRHKGIDGAYLIDMLHIVWTQFNDMMGLTSSISKERDGQDVNDAEKVRLMIEGTLNEVNHENLDRKDC